MMAASACGGEGLVIMHFMAAAPLVGYACSATSSSTPPPTHTPGNLHYINHYINIYPFHAQPPTHTHTHLHPPTHQVIYIAPLKALVRERIADWSAGMCKQLGKSMVELTGGGGGMGGAGGKQGLAAWACLGVRRVHCTPPPPTHTRIHPPALVSPGDYKYTHPSHTMRTCSFLPTNTPTRPGVTR